AKIDGLSEDIRAALENWLETGEIEGPEYSGYTAQRILNEKPGMTVLAAYLALDWIKNDPKTASKAILTPVMRFMPNAKK
ncbi:MAG: hypothetical protein IJY04_07180, partial [Clostridia bacterium]|nr:hypothetical protein [Clostridia bacterium]